MQAHRHPGGDSELVEKIWTHLPLDDSYHDLLAPSASPSHRIEPFMSPDHKTFADSLEHSLGGNLHNRSYSPQRLAFFDRELLAEHSTPDATRRVEGGVPRAQRRPASASWRNRSSNYTHAVASRLREESSSPHTVASKLRAAFTDEHMFRQRYTKVLERCSLLQDEIKEQHVRMLFLEHQCQSLRAQCESAEVQHSAHINDLKQQQKAHSSDLERIHASGTLELQQKHSSQVIDLEQKHAAQLIQFQQQLNDLSQKHRAQITDLTKQHAAEIIDLKIANQRREEV